MDTWTTSITNLFFILRGSFKALAPWMNLSKITYVDHASYDDWDMIAESLYKAIVINSIINSKGFDSLNKFPDYGMLYEDYKELNFILLDPNIVEDCYTVFVSFTGKDQFDSINYCMVQKGSLKVVNRGVMGFGNASFCLVIDSSVVLEDEIVVIL